MANNPIRCVPSSLTDQKLIETNRRKEMKELLSTLNSLVPHESSKEARTVVDELEDATNYIKELQNHIEKLKEKKEKLMGKNKMVELEDGRRNRKKHEETKPNPKLLLQVKAHQLDSSLHILLTTGSDYHPILQQILLLLHDNGTDTLHVNQTRVKHRVFHTIVAKVDGEGMGPEDGERICETVKNLVLEYKDGECTL